MKRTTQAEIDEMRARGYDQVIIREAKFSRVRTAMAEQLIGRVREAFKGVELGGGVGLLQGIALDDYASPEVIGQHRAMDEKKDWERLEVKQLNRASLCFFDAFGVRFHLPALMVADLKGELDMSLAFFLTRLDELGLAQFAALSGPQRSVVREYLLFIKDDPGDTYYRKEIDRALEEYWVA